MDQAFYYGAQFAVNTMSHPYNKRRRYSSRKMDSGVRRVENMDVGGYQQLTYCKSQRTGKRMSRRAVASKALATQLLTKIDRFQYLTTLATVRSAYALGCSTSSNYTLLPYYAFDLTMLEQNRAGPATSFGVPFMRLARDNVPASPTLGAFQWLPQINDSLTNKWIVERKPYTADVANAPYEKAMINWADIRLVMTGARTLPSSVTVEIVRFLDEAQNPSAFIDTVSTGTTSSQIWPPESLTVEDGQTHARAWTAETDNLIGNPIMIRGQAEDKLKKRVMFSRTFTFNPTSTTESDVIGHQKVFKLFHNVNQTVSYRYPGTGSGADVTAATGSAYDVTKYPIEDEQFLSLPVAHARVARTFVIIKAKVATYNLAPVNDYDVYPSFDFMVRRKVTVI